VRIVVTGAGGGLGRAFLAQVASHHDVHQFAHADLDVGDHHAVMRVVPAVHPDLVLNFAAVTKVDENETDRDRAFRDNALGPQSLALAARACDATILHVSTDYVFDGTKGSPYDESDEPRPVNAYGRAKLAGERAVRHTAVDHFIVRTGYVYGGGADYLSQAVDRLRRGEVAGGLIDHVGTPTFVHDLAARILPLVLTGRSGTYHLAGPDPASWHDVLVQAKAAGGLHGEVAEQTSASLGRPAPRPADSSLASVLVPHLGIDPMPPLRESLRAFLERTPG
jgi:dTDP-4-dehydrorhamnose reductase